jgi:uncharacterized protein YggE
MKELWSAMKDSRVMTILTMLLTGIALLLSPGLTFAQAVTSGPADTAIGGGISVLGQGVIATTPGAIRITLGVDVTDPSLPTAQTQAAQRMDAVLNALRSAGIPDSDIRTTNITVSPQYDTAPGGQLGTLRGYQIQNLVEVRSSQPESIGSLTDSAIAAGATRVQAIMFEPGDLAAVQAQARESAFQNARAKAEQIAQASGLTLGDIKLIENSDVGGGQPIPLAQGQPAVQRATPVEPGQLMVRSTVRVIWDIQP